MSNETFLSVKIIRVVGIPRKAKNVSLHVEIDLDGVTRRTGTLDSDGKAERSGTLTFPRPDNDDVDLTVQLKNSAKVIGESTSRAKELLQESIGDGALLELRKEKRFFSRNNSDRGASVLIHLASIDARTRADIEVDAAEQSVKHIEALIRRIEDRDEVIGTVIAVADGMIDIVDGIAEIHPVFSVSWKAATALYRLVHHQIQTEGRLLEMVEDMRTAFDFSKEANKLNDSTEMLKPIVKKLLGLAIDCSRFVQDYAKHNLLGRTSRVLSAKKIEDFSKKLIKFRKDVDTAIGLNTNKEVLDSKLNQQLEALLEPVKSDGSKMSDGSRRCLPGTRDTYLDRITDFLLDKAPDDTSSNVLWLTGAAGSGKSAIALTCLDRCKKEQYSPAYMFFEREKSSPYSVIRTIAYMLSSSHPPFGQHISGVLQANKTIRDDTLKYQFEKLLASPLSDKDVTRTITGPIVIILDALDECGTVDNRRELLHLLKDKFTKLARQIRVLITSRPEPDIEKVFSTGVGRVQLGLDSEGVAEYIRTELKKELTDRDRDEDCDGEIQALCDAANGLFIWASTAIKMIRLPIDARENLQSLADNIRRGKGGLDSPNGMNGLDGLYTIALEASGIWSSHSRDRGTDVLGLILFAKEALTGEVIADILGLSKRTVGHILERLRSVVSYEPGKPVRLHHASFADYLLSRDRSREKPWHIEGAKAKETVTERCFDVMARALRFNICGIESSFLPNSEIPELEERIKSEIQPHLNYACRFWSAHICELEERDELDGVCDKLKRFTKERLLYWLEVLSLTGSFSQVAGRALREASFWIMTVDAELSSFLTSAYKFVAVFALPISESVPHIYLSTISLWKEESPVAKHYSKTHLVVEVRTMGTKTRAQCIKVLETKGGLCSMAVSRNETLVASSSDDKRVMVWDIDNGELISDFEMGDGGAVAFSQDNKHIVSLSEMGTLSVWDLGSRKQVSICWVGSAKSWSRTSVAFSPNGQRVIAVCEGSAHVLDFNDEKLEPVPGLFDADTGVEFHYVSRDGKYIVSTKDSKIAVWDSGTGEQISDRIGNDGRSTAVSSDGKRVAVCSREGVRIWSVDSGHLLASSDKVYNVASVAFFPDGKRIVVGSYSGYIAVLDADSGDVIWGPIEGHGIVKSVYATLDGKRVISASEHGIRIWDVETNGGEVTSSSFVHENIVYSVAFSSDGKRVVSGSSDKTICIWDADSGELINEFEGHKSYVISVAFSPDGQRVVSGSYDGTVSIWDANSGKQLLSLEGHTDWVQSVAFSADGKHIASGSSDNTVRIWDAHTGKFVKGPLKVHAKAVRDISFSPDCKRVISSSDDETVRIWDVETETELGPFEGHPGQVKSIAISPDGKRAASGSADGVICIWDADSGELVSGSIKGHTKGITSISFSPNGRRVASGSRDKTVCIWDVGSGELVSGPLEGHTSSVRFISFSPCGNRVVSSSWYEAIRVWDVSSDHTATRCSEKSSADASAFSSSSPFTDTNTEPCAERTFSDWKLHEDGWVKGQQGELLLWIPDDMRTTLWRPRNIAVFYCKFSTKLDFTNCPIGEKWAKGYPLRNRD